MENIAYRKEKNGKINNVRSGVFSQSGVPTAESSQYFQDTWIQEALLYTWLNLDLNFQSICSFFGWVTAIVRFVPLVEQVAEINITTYDYSKIYYYYHGITYMSAGYIVG